MSTIQTTIFPKKTTTSISDALCYNATAGEAISALKIVYSSLDKVFIADDSDTKAKAKAIGVAKSVGVLDGIIPIQTSGKMLDAMFAGFTAGDTLYLNSSGSITNILPSTKYFTRIGEALGNNEILIRIEPPILL